MKLQRLRLVNFRQHADTEIVFGDGVTGIIGPNGSGKTSLLEAIAWAIYGNPAARGDNDSIRDQCAKARAPVRVELEFGLGSHSYRVERGLNKPEPSQDELERERKNADARLIASRQAAAAAGVERTKAQHTLAEEEPRWQQWVERRERTLSLHGDLRVAEQGVVVARQEFQRLDKELAEALAAREELRKLDAEVAPVSKLKAELQELDRLHREDAARREDQAKLTELARNLNALDRRIAELAQTEAGLAQATADARALALRLEAADTVATEQQGVWVREKEYAGTRRAELKKQHEEVRVHGAR